jgi:nucleotide-binding universal stress UspA family protein
MSYKTIVVHCDSGKAIAKRLSVATELAERFGATLVGLHARPPLELPGLDVGMDPTPFVRAYEKTSKADQDSAHAAFDKALKGKGLPSEWRQIDGFADEVLATNARYADLLVLGQTNEEEVNPTPGDLPESLAIATGRPVLVVPHAGTQQHTGKTVMLCWNASRESALAATEALPVLRAAEKVIILIVDPRPTDNGHGAEPGADVATWLARHGVKATVQREVAADVDVGNIILSRAADYGVDLIVMGVYGHSRVREWMLGGASRTMLASMTVPVLMAH